MKKIGVKKFYNIFEPAVYISFLRLLQMSSSGIQSHLWSVQFDKHDQHSDCPYCKKEDVLWNRKLAVTSIL